MSNDPTKCLGNKHNTWKNCNEVIDLFIGKQNKLNLEFFLVSARWIDLQIMNRDLINMNFL